MRRTLVLMALAAVAALAAAQTGGRTVLDTFAKTLKDASSLKADYTIQIIGGAPDSYSVQLKKPNLARIDTPTQLIVADGKQITTLDKAANSFSRETETDSGLKALFNADELNVFGGFFSEAAYKAAVVKNLGTKNRKGQQVTVVQAAIDDAGKKQVTYFVGNDNLARAVQIDLNDPQQKITSILDTKSFDLNGSVGDDAFAFAAPSGSTEISLDDLNSTKWHTELKEAIMLATKTHKKIFVDFFATWCGPCKMLDHDVLSTSDFKKLSSKLVFLRIDVDAQPDVAKMYGITAMPTQMVLDNNGTKLSERVGYSNASDFYGWLNPNL
jgi:outer membrane lipoprotein-sorting protein